MKPTVVKVTREMREYVNKRFNGEYNVLNAEKYGEICHLTVIAKSNGFKFTLSTTVF